jgi:hypothetical protein
LETVLELSFAAAKYVVYYLLMDNYICRYPKATMDLVEELSFGVVQEHREKQKNILQRTFVSGSEAAGAKVNRKGIFISTLDDLTNDKFNIIMYNIFV